MVPSAPELSLGELIPQNLGEQLAITGLATDDCRCGALNESMDSYTVVGVAHAELLLVTCLRRETPPGNNNLLLPVCLL